jgi:hypothetical protein
MNTTLTVILLWILFWMAAGVATIVFILFVSFVSRKAFLIGDRLFSECEVRQARISVHVTHLMLALILYIALGVAIGAIPAVHRYVPYDGLSWISTVLIAVIGTTRFIVALRKAHRRRMGRDRISVA